MSRGPSYLVGIGGSAGSLAPLEQLFRAIRPDTTASFLVVTHRNPREKGLMRETLARFTDLPVRDAADGSAVEPGVVYVVPSDKVVALQGHRIVLRSRPPDTGPPSSIDALFAAVGADFGDRGAGVLLSGMGSDGVAGLAAVKENLGVVLVQDPATAEFAPMPTAAVAAGLADFVAAPEALGQTLNRLAEHRKAPRRPGATDEPGSLRVSLPALLAAVRARTGHDFGQYKKSSIERRVERRMNLHRIKDPARYVALCERDPTELDRLFSDLLIGVTRFFRDPEVFAGVKRALPELLRTRSADRPFRIWVAGCSTGEEAYSFAILLREYWEEQGHREPLDLQIYATDLDPAAIDRARKGCYSRRIAQDVTPERLARFFVEDNHEYRVKRTIRDAVVFAVHNVINDPPFTKLDLLACRNLLIYLELELQRRLIPLFHHALRPGGLLVLGPSEGVTGLEDGFAAVESAGLKIFHRNAGPRERDAAAVPFPYGEARPTGDRSPAIRSGSRRLLPEALQNVVVEQVAPPLVVVDAGGQLLFASRRMGRYFEPPTGRASVNVFAMAREGLAVPLRSALRRALARRERITTPKVRVRTNGHEVFVDVTVWPLRDPDLPGSAMISFVEVPGEPPRKAKRSAGAQPKRRTERDRSELLELRRTKAELDTVMLEMTDSQDTLQRLNEELQSANEELQSTNEELTTSKEEMQSMNEELLSLNAELQTTNEQLATANDDMRNLLDSSLIPTLFLDRELRLKRYTEQACRIARLIPTDVGRPITDLTWSLGHESLGRDVEHVLQTLRSKEAEVIANDGSVYTMRIHPYRTIDDIIDGVVITFADVTAQKRGAAARMKRERRALLRRIVRRWPGVAYVEESGTGNVVAVSAVAERQLGYPKTVLASTNADFWRSLQAAPRAKSPPPSRGRGPTPAPGVTPEPSGPVDLELRHADGRVVAYRRRTGVLARRPDGAASYLLHTFKRRRLAEEPPHGTHQEATLSAEDRVPASHRQARDSRRE